MSEITAYDYETQRWVQGETAKVILREQLEMELDILRGPNGQPFLDSIRHRDEPRILAEDAIKRLQAQLDMLDD